MSIVNAVSATARTTQQENRTKVRSSHRDQEATGTCRNRPLGLAYRSCVLCQLFLPRQCDLARFLFFELWPGLRPRLRRPAKAGANSSLDLKVSQSDFGAKFDRSRCDDKGKQVVSLDANGDGKPDVIKLFLSASQDGHTVQQLVCKQTDLDFDGKIEFVQYYSPAASCSWTSTP